MNANTIANNIRLLRVQKGVSQEDVADFLNISQSTYAKIENGSTNLSAERLVQLASYFDVKPNSILNTGDEKLVFNKLGTNHNFIENYQSGLKEAYSELIFTLKEEIKFLRKMLEERA